MREKGNIDCKENLPKKTKQNKKAEGQITDIKNEKEEIKILKALKLK